jgi:hypothetical protein
MTCKPTTPHHLQPTQCEVLLIPVCFLLGVVHVFAGHLHLNAGGSYHGMPVTTTTALGAQLGDDVPGLRIVKVMEKEIEQSFYSLDNLPTTIDL